MRGTESADGSWTGLRGAGGVGRLGGRIWRGMPPASVSMSRMRTCVMGARRTCWRGRRRRGATSRAGVVQGRITRTVAWFGADLNIGVLGRQPSAWPHRRMAVDTPCGGRRSRGSWLGSLVRAWRYIIRLTRIQGADECLDSRCSLAPTDRQGVDASAATVTFGSLYEAAVP